MTELIQARRRENEKRKDALRKASSIPHQEAEGCVYFFSVGWSGTSHAADQGRSMMARNQV